MPKTILMAQGLDGYVRLTIGKGCVAKLRAADWYKALADGKAERRACEQARREAQAQAEREAETLEWIE
jgi:hypothetical protein